MERRVPGQKDTTSGAPSPRTKARSAATAKRAPKKRERQSAPNLSPSDVVGLESRTTTPLGTITTAQAPRTVPKRPQARTEVKKVRPVLKLLNGLLTLMVVALLAIGGTVYYMEAAVDADGPLSAAKLLVIPRNDGIQQIAERLEREGMVSDRHMFLAGVYTMRAASIMPGGRTYSLKAGQYEIKPNASIRSIVETLSDGRSVLTKVTIPEGLTSYAIVERLKADQTLSGDVREVPPEGTLLPETYSLPSGSPRQTLIDMMAAAQKKLVDQLWAERREGLPLKTPQEAIQLASIVERETGRNDERDRVAGVFVNRLRKNMRLQSDPTILYGLQLGKVQWGKPILLSEKNSHTAHNTYFITGLPATPICNPGRAALEATLKPAATNDLYFVADGHGGHIFATTDKEHQLNVLKWRQLERERTNPAAAAPTQGKAPIPTTTTLNAAPGPAKGQ